MRTEEVGVQVDLLHRRVCPERAGQRLERKHVVARQPHTAQVQHLTRMG